MTIDTGAQLTVVKAGLVEEVEYTGETIRLLDFRGKASEVPLANVWVHTVPPVYRVDFLCFLVFFVRSESYFLQYSSEKSQSWQECGQVTPHHNCIVKIY